MAQNLEEQICELVRGYIHLYDSSMPGHRDKQHCRNSWEEIAAALGLPVKTVQNKWTLARDRYVRAHNKAASKKSGHAAGGPEHPVLQRLAWLKGHVRHRNTVSNFDVSVFYSFIHYTFFILSQHCSPYIIGFTLFLQITVIRAVKVN